MRATEALEQLRRSVEGIVSGEAAVAVAYSGGLDSSVLAAVAREFVEVRCYTCATKGSFDAMNARNRAESESLGLTMIELSAEEVRGLAAEASSLLGTSNPTRLAYTVPVLAALRGCRERLMLAGHGADELFGGYAKYVSAERPERSMDEDLERMLREADAFAGAARAIGRRAAFPFATQEMIAFAGSIPLDEKISASERKIVLREVARLLGLESHALPKKAAQYSSGVLKEMRRMARAEGTTLSDWTDRLLVKRQRSS